MEAAYANQIHPHKFKKKLVGLHGINGALAHWAHNTPPKSKPRQKSFSFSPTLNPAPLVKRPSAEAQQLTEPSPVDVSSPVPTVDISQLENV